MSQTNQTNTEITDEELLEQEITRVKDIKVDKMNSEDLKIHVYSLVRNMVISSDKPPSEEAQNNIKIIYESAMISARLRYQRELSAKIQADNQHPDIRFSVRLIQLFYDQDEPGEYNPVKIEDITNYVAI